MIEGILLTIYITSGVLALVGQMITPPCQDAPQEFRGQAEGTGLFLCFLPILNTIFAGCMIYDFIKRTK